MDTVAFVGMIAALLPTFLRRRPLGRELPVRDVGAPPPPDRRASEA